jgi:hypothetical protein
LINGLMPFQPKLRNWGFSRTKSQMFTISITEQNNCGTIGLFSLQQTIFSLQKAFRFVGVTGEANVIDVAFAITRYRWR